LLPRGRSGPPLNPLSGLTFPQSVFGFSPAFSLLRFFCHRFIFIVITPCLWRGLVVFIVSRCRFNSLGNYYWICPLAGCVLCLPVVLEISANMRGNFSSSSPGQHPEPNPIPLLMWFVSSSLLPLKGFVMGFVYVLKFTKFRHRPRLIINLAGNSWPKDSFKAIKCCCVCAVSWQNRL